MKKFYLILIIFLVYELKTYASNSNISFSENKGQWPTSIRYRATIPQGFLFLHNNSLQYSFYDAKAFHDNHKAFGSSQVIRDEATMQAHSFIVNFEGAKALPKLIAKKPFAWKHHYLLGNEPKYWTTDVTSYAEVIYQNMYEGIDLKMYEKSSSLKYEFIVAPAANPNIIKMHYQYANSILLDKEGNLIIKTSLGEVKEKKPYCYQLIAGKQVEVPAHFLVRGNYVSFVFPKNYDPTYSLIIDPEITFSTYSGSTSTNIGYNSTYDNEGNFYAIGTVNGANFPTTQGAFQVQYKGNTDISISKYNPTGTTLLFATFLGGNDLEQPSQVVVNQAQELFLVGYTKSSNFPTLANSFDKTYNNGDGDAFVISLNNLGSQLLGATYLGGNDFDTFTALCLDEQQNIYAIGNTNSVNFPTQEAFQNVKKLNRDGVVVKLSANLSTLFWATYLGGKGYDDLRAIKYFDQKIYLVGATSSADLATTPNVLFKNFQGGANDGLIAAITAEGKMLHMSYLGTNKRDEACLIDIDKGGNIHIAGITEANANYPTTPTAYKHNGGRIFIHGLDPSFSKTLYATKLIPDNELNDDYHVLGAFKITDCQTIHLSLYTLNATLPTTNNAFQKQIGGKTDLYLCVLKKDATSLLYATYIGGTDGDHFHGTSHFDEKGVLYQAVCICDVGKFPITPGVIFPQKLPQICSQLSLKFDATLAMLQADFQILDPITLLPIQKGCNIKQALLKYQGTPTDFLAWEVDGQIIAQNQTEILIAFDEPKAYKIRLIIQNLNTCNQELVVEKIFETFKVDVTASGEATICKGESTQLTATGGLKYTWTPAIGLDNPHVANPMATPIETTIYAVEIETKEGCKENRPIKIEIVPDIQLDFDVEVIRACGKMPEIHLINRTEGAELFTWLLGNGEKLQEAHPGIYIYPEGGEYEISLMASNKACSVTQSKKVKIEENTTEITNVITPNGDGKNDQFTLPIENCTLEIYNRWGKLVYQQENYTNTWGKEAEVAVYYYIITLPTNQKCKGWVQVLK